MTTIQTGAIDAKVVEKQRARFRGALLWPAVCDDGLMIDLSLVTG